MLTLVLMRHAQAAGFSGHGDFGRPLTPAGVGQAARAARALSSALVQVAGEPDVIVVSSALRAQQTAKPLIERFPTATVINDRLIYTADELELLDFIRSVGSGKTMVVIGHEPIISTTATWLCGPAAGSAAGGGPVGCVTPGVATATAIIMQIQGQWADLTWGMATHYQTLCNPAQGNV